MYEAAARLFPNATKIDEGCTVHGYYDGETRCNVLEVRFPAHDPRFLV